MGRAFDISRRQRPRKKDPGRPTRRQQRSFTTFLFLIALAALLIFANKGFKPQASVVTPTPTRITPTTTATAPYTSATTLPPTPSPSPTESIETPSPSPTPTPDKNSITMSVLNGSGTAGQANTLRAQLVKEGFSVRRIALAPETRETTIIYYRAGKKAEAELIASFIPDRVIEYEENSTRADLDDLLIIVGKK